MKRLILVTNDDGIDSPGLRAAAEAAGHLGEALIVAPITAQMGMGRSFPRTEKQGVIEKRPMTLGTEIHPCYAVHGSPAQAVAHAILEIAPRAPDLCVSGINDGENLGGTNLVSGTVGAALEAAYFGIPAMAVSLGSESCDLFLSGYATERWTVPIHLVTDIASRVLSRGVPEKLALLNINIPSDATLDTEIRLTLQSRQSHYVCRRPGPRDFSTPCRLPIECVVNRSALELDSDLYAFVVDRVVSVTPMGFDLTARDAAGKPLMTELFE